MKNKIYATLNVLYFVICAILTIKIYIWFTDQLVK